MLITNANIITWNEKREILPNFGIRISDSIISDIDKSEVLQSKYPNDDVMDARGQYLMPGLICAHTHFYGAFSRGLYIPGNPPASFPEILSKLWWPLDQSLNKESVKYSALVCMIDAIRHGTTTLIDHHASPNFITGSLDVIEEAFEQTGLRGMVCYEVTDRGGVQKAEEGIAENIDMIQKIEQAPKDSRVKAIFGMHAGLTLSEETLKKCRKALPEGYGVHIHVAEHVVDEHDSLDKTGERIIDRLNRHGFLGDQSILAHGVHLDIKEIEQLIETKTWLTHQPRSNMNNAVGMADVDAMLRAGVKLCLGNDGFSNAMWDEWRTCYLVHKSWNRDPRRMNGNDVIKMAVYNNAEMASHFFDGAKIGVIQKGAKADLILVDYDPITEVTPDNVAWQILFGFRDSMVTTTIVDGKVLMKDREIQGLNVKEISQNAVRVSKEVWQEYARQF